MGTLTTFLLGIVLIQKIEYRIIEKWIIILGCVQFFFGVWSLLSFSSLSFLGHFFLPEKVMNAMFQFHQEGRNTGINSQTSPFAFYLSQLLGVLYIKYYEYITWKKIILCIPILLVLFTTSRRGALIATFAGIFLCRSLINKYSVQRFFVVVLLSLVLVIGTVKGLMFLGIDFSVFDRFSIENIDFSDYNSVNELSSSRLSLIVNAYRFFTQTPILGKGFKFFFETMGQDVHNTFLQLLCESGVLGFGIFICFFIYNMSNTLLIIKRSGCKYKEILYSFYMQFFFLIMCFIENPISDRYIFLAYIIAVALLYNFMLQSKCCKYKCFNI